MSCYNLFYLNWANLKTVLLWNHRREKPEIPPQLGKIHQNYKHYSQKTKHAFLRKSEA